MRRGGLQPFLAKCRNWIALLEADEDDEEEPNEDSYSCQCGACGRRERPGHRFQCCGRCGMARYASRECQVAHWPEHRAHCKVARKAKKELLAIIGVKELSHVLEATRAGQPRILQALLNAGGGVCDVDGARDAALEHLNQYQYFPLLLAAESSDGRAEEARMLLAAGANVNQRQANGFTAANAAAERNQLEVLQVLTEYNADFSLADQVRAEAPWRCSRHSYPPPPPLAYNRFGERRSTVPAEKDTSNVSHFSCRKASTPITHYQTTAATQPSPRSSDTCQSCACSKRTGRTSPCEIQTAARFVTKLALRRSRLAHYFPPDRRAADVLGVPGKQDACRGISLSALS